MKYLLQFGIILGVSFAGEILNSVIPFPVPASIYGIIIMFILLSTHIVKLENVKDTAEFLIAIMPVMFIPAAAGIINSWNIIKPSLFAYLIITVVSTVVVMALSGLITQYIIKRDKRRNRK